MELHDGFVKRHSSGGSNPQMTFVWGCSSVGRASALHAEGRGFDSLRLHQIIFGKRNKGICYFVPKIISAVTQVTVL